MYKRGDVFWADLSPVIGSEQDGVRPVDCSAAYKQFASGQASCYSCARLYAGLAAIFGCVVRTDTDSR